PPELAPSTLPDMSPPNVLAEPAPALTATLDPANVPAPSEAAVDAAAPGTEAQVEAAPAQDENGLPQLAPIPGTVARNAPKRS
ncbi:Sec-independent protein translocase TatB, partial [Corallococcus exercitus]|nr:Sec-independent protein translocase TatB [Corallococcus exercitus]